MNTKPIREKPHPIRRKYKNIQSNFSIIGIRAIRNSYSLINKLIYADIASLDRCYSYVCLALRTQRYIRTLRFLSFRSWVNVYLHKCGQNKNASNIKIYSLELIFCMFAPMYNVLLLSTGNSGRWTLACFTFQWIVFEKRFQYFHAAACLLIFVQWNIMRKRSGFIYWMNSIVCLLPLISLCGILIHRRRVEAKYEFKWFYKKWKS